MTPGNPRSVKLEDAVETVEHEAIHGWFNLTYANYLCLPRTLLQSMPDEWQTRFVKCLRELDEAYWHLDHAVRYTVSVRDDKGRFTTDPIPHYNRGRTRIEPVPSGQEPPL
jgi:hypothetical protein